MNSLNELEELNKLEKEIRETQKLLQNTDTNLGKLSALKKQRTIFAVLALIFLSAFLWAMFLKDKGRLKNLEKLNNRNVVLVNKDSLDFYKAFFTENKDKEIAQEVPITQVDDTQLKSIKDQKIVYSVQIGAFRNFQLTSDNLLNLKEFAKNDFNKFSLGNYSKYAEAKVLRDSLKRLGFRDCFITAQSYGKSINIHEALKLSEETQFLED